MRHINVWYVPLMFIRGIYLRKPLTDSFFWNLFHSKYAQNPMSNDKKMNSGKSVELLAF